jgi:hypothetical protein
LNPENRFVCKHYKELNRARDAISKSRISSLFEEEEFKKYDELICIINGLAEENVLTAREARAFEKCLTEQLVSNWINKAIKNTFQFSTNLFQILLKQR